jgi:hypothetical protein
MTIFRFPDSDHLIVVRVGPHRSPHTREPLDTYMYHGVVLDTSILLFHTV